MLNHRNGTWCRKPLGCVGLAYQGGIFATKYNPARSPYINFEEMCRDA